MCLRVSKLLNTIIHINHILSLWMITMIFNLFLCAYKTENEVYTESLKAIEIKFLLPQQSQFSKV